MTLDERVKELSYLIPEGVRKRANFNWIRKMPFEGVIATLFPNNIKIRYLSESVDLGEMQKRSEVWQPLSALASICGASLFGLNFSKFNLPTRIVGSLGSVAANIPNALFIIGIPYRLSSHHDEWQWLRSVPLVDPLFRFIGDYDEKPFPASMTIELFYKWIIERGLGEERLFSVLDSVQNYVHLGQGHVKNFYWVTLPKYASSFPV